VRTRGNVGVDIHPHVLHWNHRQTFCPGGPSRPLGSLRRENLRILVRALYDNRAAWRLLLVPLVLTGLTVPLNLGLPLVQKQLIDDVLLAGRVDRLLPTIGLYALVWLLEAVLHGLSGPLQTSFDA